LKSIKPGRGPSLIGVIGSILGIIFGIFWVTVVFRLSGSMSGLMGLILSLIGTIFIVVGITQAVYNFKNAARKNRFSEYDIVSSSEEKDPLNERFGKKTLENNEFSGKEMGSYCPYCGSKVSPDFEYCSKCGAKLPK